MSICNRNRIMTGLRFLLRVTLRRLDLAAEIYHIREPQKIPQVMSADETKRLLAVATSLKARVLLSLGYGCGLRAGEVVRLKVKHIDSAQRIIRIEQSKGGKDRNVMLSAETLDLLRQWWKARPSGYDTTTPLQERWLFPGSRRGKPMTTRQLNRLFHEAADARGDQEERDAARAAPQLRDPPAGARHRYQESSKRSGVTTNWTPTARYTAQSQCRACEPRPAEGHESAIERCRTAALGGHVARCENDRCAHTVIVYNSCRNRHCPKCQGAAAREWLAEREAELLPVAYFHVVYTLPAAIRDIAAVSEQGGDHTRPAVQSLGRARTTLEDRGV